MRGAAAIPLLAALLSLAAPAFAEDESPDPSATESATELAEDFADPLTTLPQVFLQDVYTPTSYGTPYSANRVIARIIVPRLPKYSLFPFVQLIRPTFSVVTLPNGRGGTRTVFGDMQLFDLAVIPWPSRESGLRMGVGLTFVFPTARRPPGRAGGLAGRPGVRGDLQGSPRLAARVPHPRPDLVCLHVTRP